MEPETIILSEISQSEKDKYHRISLIRAKGEKERERNKPRNRLLTTGDKLVVTSGEVGGGWGK